MQNYQDYQKYLQRGKSGATTANEQAMSKLGVAILPPKNIPGAVVLWNGGVGWAR